MSLRVRRHKFGAKPCVVQGQRFASQKEAARFLELRLLEKAGEIQGLCLQPRYPLHVGETKIGEYRGDFEFVQGGRHVVEDVKGGKATMTALWRWKVKHFTAQYGLTVKVV